MKVVHLMHYAGVAGVERHVQFLLPAMRSRGVDVELFVVHTPDKPVDDYINATREASVPVIDIIVPYVKSLLFTPHFFTILSRITHVLRQKAPDIVHTHMVYADFYGLLAAKLAGVRHVMVTCHKGQNFYCTRYWQTINPLLWRMRSGGITVSDQVKQFVEQYEGAAPDKIRTIYHGIPERKPGPDPLALRAQWGIEPDAPVVGSVSRLHIDKGLCYALDALAQVQRQMPNVHYVITGDGSLRESLEAQASSLGIADRTHFLGWQDDIYSVMSTFDVLLMPSLNEGLGIVLLEAMESRLPIVSTTIDAIQEVVIDGETGFLVQPADADALVEPLMRMLTSPDLRGQMGEAGYARRQAAFSIEKMTEQTIDYYREVTGMRWPDVPG